MTAVQKSDGSESLLVRFLMTVLASCGCYALFLAESKSHIWANSIAELAAHITRLTNKMGVYFALSGFATPTERTTQNARWRRCFAFDIDAGPDKAAKHGNKVYTSREDAIDALTKWCGGVGLVPMWVIGSGAGLHVYFVLDADASIEHWMPVALAIKAKALADGLKIDAGPTANAALVLRPLGTLHKSGVRVHVLHHRPDAIYSLDTIRAKFAAFAPRPRTRASLLDVNALIDQGPPKHLAAIYAKCPAMARCMRLRGDVAEPLWRAMLGVIKYTVEGEDAAQTYSEGHPDYSQAETHRKLDRWTAGPTTCATFEAEGTGECATCEFRGRLRSPIMLGVIEGGPSGLL